MLPYHPYRADRVQGAEREQRTRLERAEREQRTRLERAEREQRDAQEHAERLRRSRLEYAERRERAEREQREAHEHAERKQCERIHRQSLLFTSEERRRRLECVEQEERERLERLERVYASLVTKYTRLIHENNASNPTDTVNSSDDPSKSCVVCSENYKIIAFQCGHKQTCSTCAHKLDKCPICRERITTRMRIFD